MCTQSICQQVVTSHYIRLQQVLKQLAASLWITSFDNQLAECLLTTVVNKLSQVMRTHPGIGLLATSLCLAV